MKTIQQPWNSVVLGDSLNWKQGSVLTVKVEKEMKHRDFWLYESKH